MTAPTTHQDQGSWVALRVPLPVAPDGAPESPLALPAVSKQKRSQDLWLPKRGPARYGSRRARSLFVGCRAETETALKAANRPARTVLHPQGGVPSTSERLGNGVPGVALAIRASSPACTLDKAVVGLVGRQTGFEHAAHPAPLYA